MRGIDEGGDAACWAGEFEDELFGGGPPPGRLRDRLPVNAPYEGIVAEAYDAWMPVEQVFPDDAVYEQLLTEVDGTVLALGCGTGRPMLRWLAAGHAVEGIDASADMLAVLRRNAEARSLRPVVHHGEVAPLALGRTFAAIVCPVGTFTLLDDETRIRLALRSYLDHLEPGGRLALGLSELRPTGADTLVWKLRRTGTLADGTTVVVHEAEQMDDGDRYRTIYGRLEVYDAEGRLLDTWLRRHRLRSWTREESRDLLEQAGFTGVEHHGTDLHWVTTARR